jgi:putative transposase
VIVKPETVIAWRRRKFREYWTTLTRSGRPGRPSIPREVRDLIRRMSSANPLWGAPHIVGELGKIGIDLPRSTVAKYMVRRWRPPSATWRAFLKNHIREIVATDFFVVPTVKNQVLFVFLVLAHERRRVLHFNVTANPTAEWAGQQVVEAFPWTADRIDSARVLGSHGRGQRTAPEADPHRPQRIATHSRPSRR